MSPVRRERSRTSPQLVALLLLVIAAALIVTRRDARERARAAQAETPAIAPAAERYRAAVDEAPGIAVDIVLDNSGSMGDTIRGDVRSKSESARRAIEAMLNATDRAIARDPDTPVKVALHAFSTRTTTVLPMQPYRHDSVRVALRRVPEPRGGTAIGDALDVAREELYRSGLFRKNVIVVTDGRNTAGASPATIAREIYARSGGEVRIWFVAFDTDAHAFDFVHAVNGRVVEAANERSLDVTLDSLYQRHVLVEAPVGVPAAAAAPTPTTTAKP